MKNPSPEAKELYRKAVLLVHQNPEHFAGIGQQLDDDETGYSDIALRRRMAAFKREWQRKGPHTRRTNTYFSTRSGWKKRYANGSLGVKPWPKPRSKARRFAEAWHDTVSLLNECPLERQVAQTREGLAGRIVLMTWLLADPDAHQWEVPLTEFQRWNWNAGGGQSPLKYKAWLGDSEQEQGIDDGEGRYALYENYLIKQEVAWMPHLQEAVREMMQLIDSRAQVEKALDMIDAKPGTFALLAGRLRDMPRRQPPPTHEQARLEINSICAQAVRYYKHCADAGVPRFDKSLVNFSLTGDPRSDQRKALTNDADLPRWLDIATSVSKHFPGRIVPDPGAPKYIEQSRPEVVIGTTSGHAYEWTERYVTEKTYSPEHWPQRASEYADVLECLDELARIGHVNTTALPHGQVETTTSTASDALEQPPALTTPQRITLRALNGFDPSVLATTERISEVIKGATRLSEETVRQCVKRLIALELAERPQGERNGARLTIKGRRLAGKIAD